MVSGANASRVGVAPEELPQLPFESDPKLKVKLQSLFMYCYNKETVSPFSLSLSTLLFISLACQATPSFSMLHAEEQKSFVCNVIIVKMSWSRINECGWCQNDLQGDKTNGHALPA